MAFCIFHAIDQNQRGAFHGGRMRMESAAWCINAVSVKRLSQKRWECACSGFKRVVDDGVVVAVPGKADDDGGRNMPRTPSTRTRKRRSADTRIGGMVTHKSLRSATADDAATPRRTTDRDAAGFL
jgi:hypothetical protein